MQVNLLVLVIWLSYFSPSHFHNLLSQMCPRYSLLGFLFNPRTYGGRGSAGYPLLTGRVTEEIEKNRMVILWPIVAWAAKFSKRCLKRWRKTISTFPKAFDLNYLHVN